MHTWDGCFLASYSTATELAERFNQFFIEKHIRELETEIADGQILALSGNRISTPHF